MDVAAFARRSTAWYESIKQAIPSMVGLSPTAKLTAPSAGGRARLPRERLRSPAAVQPEDVVAASAQITSAPTAAAPKTRSDRRDHARPPCRPWLGLHAMSRHPHCSPDMERAPAQGGPSTAEGTSATSASPKGHSSASPNAASSIGEPPALLPGGADARLWPLTSSASVAAASLQDPAGRSSATCGPEHPLAALIGAEPCSKGCEALML
mmetsp:Transcript_78290/g.227060  ORF Transcript_78290/g.227060 Transcript_78290/m.227060 type:complete len:210 (-) Transcript_78290:14-643(-)